MNSFVFIPISHILNRFAILLIHLFLHKNYLKYLNFSSTHCQDICRITLRCHSLSPLSPSCLWNVCECETPKREDGRDGIKQINQVATCHSLVLSISKLITSFNEDKRFVCSCLSVLPVRLSAATLTIYTFVYKNTRHMYAFFACHLAVFSVCFYLNIFSLVKWSLSLWSSLWRLLLLFY